MSKQASAFAILDLSHDGKRGKSDVKRSLNGSLILRNQSNCMTFASCVSMRSIVYY